MKKSKKGFTLIELLAVIVILAIIALIATPVVLKIIEKARQGSAQNSAYGVKKAAELYYSTILVTNSEGLSSDVIFSCNGNKCEATVDNDKDSVNDYLDIDGTIPSSGKVTVKTDGNILYNNLVINNFNCAYNDGKFKCTKNGSSNVVTVGNIVTTVNSITIPFNIDDVNDALALNDNVLSNMVLDIELNSSISVKCEYGTTEKYGQEGVLGNNSCLLPNLDANTKYYYKITYTNSNGQKYEQKGDVNTNALILGETVYFNPTTGKACYNYNKQNSYTGYNGVNNLDLQNGCMKWYIVSVSGDSVDLIADHNITYNLKWADVPENLVSSTTGWVSGLNQRLISPDTISDITGASLENTLKWNSNKTYVTVSSTDTSTVDLDSYVSTYYLNGSGANYNYNVNGWKKKSATTPRSNRFSWLFDYTYNCFESGCSVEDNNIYNSSTNNVLGYWTNTSVNGTDGQVWFIVNAGMLGIASETVVAGGIRPVITVQTNNLYLENEYINVTSDTLAPSVKSSLVKIRNNKKQLQIDFIEEQSGMDSYCLTKNNDINSCTFEKTEYDSVFTDINEYGTYYVYVVDKAGNVSNSIPLDLKRTCDNKEVGSFSSLNVNENYCTGDSISNYGGYKWHVVGDNGTDIILMLDDNQLGDNGFMSHCSLDNDGNWNCDEYIDEDTSEKLYYYTWEKSNIRNYLNNDDTGFLSILPDEIKNKMVTTKICGKALENDNGYLIDRIQKDDITCYSVVEDKVRLLTEGEYDYIVKNIGSGGYWYSDEYITPINSNNYNSWLYSDNVDAWWTMTGYRSDGLVTIGSGDDFMVGIGADNQYKVRPVITIQR